MTSRLKVGAIDHIVLHVKDLGPAREFYVDFLGLEVHHERPTQCFLKCGNQGLALFQTSADTHPGKEMNHLALRVEAAGLEAIRTALVRAGIEIRGRAGDPDCIYITDPDGHPLQLLADK